MSSIVTQHMESIPKTHVKGRRNLPQRIVYDGSAALVSTIFVSPIMVVIDRYLLLIQVRFSIADQQNRAVVEKATGTSTIVTSMRTTLRSIACHPLQFLTSRPLRAMLMLYSATYLTANICDTLQSQRDDLSASTTTSSTTKLAAVTTANVGFALYKDASFARTFGTTPTRAFPAISYLPLLIRDGITLFGTFNVPAMIAPGMPEQIDQHMSRLSVAQLIAPAASQFLATPLHVLGLDLYERKVSLRERLSLIRKAWISISTTRALRIIPAYGIGGVLNNNVRCYLMEGL